MKKIILILLSYNVLMNLVKISECFTRFDDEDYNEFSNSFIDQHLDIQRNAKPLTSHHLNEHKLSDSFDFDHMNDQFKSDQFKDDYKREKYQYDAFKNTFFKDDTFKRDPFKSDVLKNEIDKNDFKIEPFKKDAFKSDDVFKSDTLTDFPMETPKMDIIKPNKSIYHHKPFNRVLKKKEPKNDNFNRSDSFINEYNANFDDSNHSSDFDENEHDAWFEQNRHFDIPRRDPISEKLVNDYRQPTPRTPFRVPMIPVPAFYPQPFPVLPTPFLPQPVNRPQPQQQPPQQQQQQQIQQPQNRPTRPSNNQIQQNQMPGWFYPFYPMMPVMPHSIPNSMPNQANSNNIQLHSALQNMMNRNSFLGFVDPLIIVAIIAIPVIAMLGFSSVIMPFIPVIIYILNIFFPLSAASGRRRRKKRSIILNEFCLLLNDDLRSLDKKWPHLVRNDQILYITKFNELEYYLRQFHRSICKFNL